MSEYIYLSDSISNSYVFKKKQKEQRITTKYEMLSYHISYWCNCQYSRLVSEKMYNSYSFELRDTTFEKKNFYFYYPF